MHYVQLSLLTYYNTKIPIVEHVNNMIIHVGKQKFHVTFTHGSESSTYGTIAPGIKSTG